VLPTDIETGNYEFAGDSVPGVNVSASKDSACLINVSLCNLDPHKSVKIEASLEGAKARRINGQVLTAEKINAHNTFDAAMQIKDFGLRPVTKDGVASPQTVR